MGNIVFIRTYVFIFEMKSTNTKSMASYRYFEEYDQPVTDSLIDNYSKILSTIGEDAAREGIVKTPERAAKAMQFLTSGNCQDPAEILKSAMFAEPYNDMVIIKGWNVYYCWYDFM